MGSMVQPSRTAVLAGLAAATLAPAVARAASTSLRVGAAPTDATAQHFYAQDLGTFKAAGLDVEISELRNIGALSAALIGGSLDVIAGSIVPIAEAHARGIDLRVIAPGNVYTGQRAARSHAGQHAGLDRRQRR
jgi:ABC-type nitrate/sulfonate/bicarbonate transport system substrate-binding protein